MRKDVSGLLVRLSDQSIAAMEDEGHWKNTTVFDLAKSQLYENPNKIILIDDDQSLTVREVYEQATRLASALIARGMRPGDVIAMQLPNWAEAVVIYLAATMAGLIINPIIPILRDAEVCFCLKDSKTKLAFIPGIFRNFDHAAMLEALRPQLPDLQNVCIVRGGSEGTVSWSDLLAAPLASEFPKLDPNAIKVIIYTSGTTGRPKGVLHSHNTLHAEALSLIPSRNMDAKDVIFMASSVSHVTGSVLAIEMPWIIGATVVLQSKWSASSAIDIFLKRGVTFTGSSTPFLRELLLAAKSRSEHLPLLKRFSCGGMPVPAGLVYEAMEWFSNCVVSRIYGSSEVPSVTLGALTRTDKYTAAESDGTLGRNVEVLICDPITGNSVPDGAEGEILARAPEMFLGYANPHDNAEAFTEDGFFRTGDIGRLEGNRLTITDRIKDLIIRGGENLSPKEIEDHLLQHPGVDQVAVVAMPDERLGETPSCFVVLKQGHNMDAAEVARFLRSRGLARQKIPNRVETLEDLPRNMQGKILKNVLRERMKALCAH